jgi:hypothetical protein
MCLPVKPYKVEREWTHAGLQCAVVQAREAANRCGYVRVPPGHPLHGKEMSDDGVTDLNVHYGITFGEIEPCSEHEDGIGWWLGFDCCHCDDASYDPTLPLESITDPQSRSGAEMDRKFWGNSPRHYWTEEEVVAETNRLAEQLATRSA